MAARIEVLPTYYRTVSRRLWPLYPPIFGLGEPVTRADVVEAIALYRELDDHSKSWYGHDFPERLQQRYSMG